MARILTLNPPFNGLSSVVNVLGRVGPGESNNPDDVRVVQRLLEMCSRGKATAGNIGYPQSTGHFDAATGFWIYHVQNKLRRQIVDGVVSPAHGAHYAPGGGVWTIVLFNYFAKDNCPADYAAFCAKPV